VELATTWKSTARAWNAGRRHGKPNAVFRSFHTIKGWRRFHESGGDGSACHLTENLFEAAAHRQAPVTPLAIEAALQASGFGSPISDRIA